MLSCRLALCVLAASVLVLPGSTVGSISPSAQPGSHLQQQQQQQQQQQHTYHHFPSLQGIWQWIQTHGQQMIGASSSSSRTTTAASHQHNSRRSMLQDAGQSSSDGTSSKDQPGSFGGVDPTQRTSWDAEPGYSSHYSSNKERPNLCKVTHKVPAPLGREQYNFTEGAKDYVPFIGTSLVRDSQLMLLRLYYSIDFPVKWFVVVVGQQAAAGKNAIAYQVKHILEYAQDKVGTVVITCQHQPAVSESWNAIFQTFKDEPWGVYMARDTFWERGALAKLNAHGWEAAETGSVDVGFVKWSNMGEREAIHNTFMMTSKAIKRFGLWDENIYPALCEDLDMMHRAKIMDPPLKEHQYMDVLAVHGKRTNTSYWPGAWLNDDPHDKQEQELTHFTVHVRHGPNCCYFMRKWGCPSEAGDWMSMTGDCRFKTPFNKSVPHWYWHTNKALRARDRLIKVERKDKDLVQVSDAKTNQVIFDVPKHYGEWSGYFEQTGMCRLSGYLGRTVGPDGRTMCL